MQVYCFSPNMSHCGSFAVNFNGDYETKDKDFYECHLYVAFYFIWQLHWCTLGNEVSGHCPGRLGAPVGLEISPGDYRACVIIPGR